MAADKALRGYLNILAGKNRPRFKTADLSARAERAESLLAACELCEHKCLVDRNAGELGECKVGTGMSVASAFDHLGEEPFFVPSFTIFFRSCTFHCQFCQNWDISQVAEQELTPNMSETALARHIDAHAYCKNVNFVGGEPTPYLPFILRTLTDVRADIPVIWNSNFYMSEQSMDILAGTVDVYLSDFKYGNDACAERLSGIKNYWRIVKRNHQLAFNDAEVVIRHLILPGHLDCCTKPILRHIADNMGEDVVVNLMDQYRPCYNAAGFPELTGRITADEFRQAVKYAEQLGLNFII